MFLGREPIQFLCQSVVALTLVTPHFCFGQSKPQEEENTWRSPAQKKISDAPAESRPPGGESPMRPGEITDPWNAREADVAERSPNDAEDMSGDGEPWRDLNLNNFDDERPSRATPRHWDRRQEQSLHTLAPYYSLWLGVGAGWTLPFGDLWGTCTGFDSFGRCAAVTGVPSHDYVAQGPALELDLGARLAHNYNLYGLWEHSWLGAGSATSADRGQPDHGDTDFFALGLRVSTDPDELGFVLDIAVGTRRLRAHWADGTELQMTDAPFETRMGIGADVRLSDHWSLSPMLSLGLGSFGKAEWVLPDKTVQTATQPSDVALTHGWIGLQMAAHVDAFGTK